MKVRIVTTAYGKEVIKKHFKKLCYTEGIDYTVKYNKDEEDNNYYININTFEEVLEIAKKLNTELIIRVPNDEFEAMIEIYDDYRE